MSSPKKEGVVAVTWHLAASLYDSLDQEAAYDEMYMVELARQLLAEGLEARRANRKQ